MTRKIFLLVLAFAICGGVLFAQEVSEKKDIAVFKLSYYDWKVPTQALGMVDSQIQDVFVNLGRFNILGMNYRLASGDINEFIGKIREFKEQNAEIPESVQLGQEAFTEADFNQLVNSFIVIIPVLTYYNLSVDDDGDHKVEMETSFTVVNVETIETMAYFTVETDGYAAEASTAIKRAVDEIALKLQYEVRKIPEFQLKSGIVDILRLGQVVIQFGKDMGLKKGDEYAIVESEEVTAGYEKKKKKALLVIKSVEEDFSIAKVVYSRGKPMIGEQVEEIPKVGLDTTVYGHAILDITDPATMFSEMDVIIGVRQSLSRGFYNFRPLVGIEVPVTLINSVGLLANGFPLTWYVGGELDFWFGRFQLVPSASIGMGLAIPLQDTSEFRLSHLGGMAQLNLNYLIHDYVRLFIDAGYAYWFGMGGLSQYSYGGILAGVGIQIRY